MLEAESVAKFGISITVLGYLGVAVEMATISAGFVVHSRANSQTRVPRPPRRRRWRIFLDEEWASKRPSAGRSTRVVSMAVQRRRPRRRRM